MALKLVAAVNHADAEDRAEDNYHTAKAILTEMKGCLNSTDDEWTESCEEIASELAQTGYDKSGFWCPPEEDEPGIWQPSDSQEHGTGVVYGIAIASIFWAIVIGLICIVKHYAPLIDGWRW